jgi:hypothetical protein
MELKPCGSSRITESDGEAQRRVTGLMVQPVHHPGAVAVVGRLPYSDACCMTHPDVCLILLQALRVPGRHPDAVRAM